MSRIPPDFQHYHSHSNLDKDQGKGQVWSQVWKWKLGKGFGKDISNVVVGRNKMGFQENQVPHFGAHNPTRYVLSYRRRPD